MDDKMMYFDPKDEGEEQGLVFSMRAFMRERVAMPDREKMLRVLKKHLGNVECFSHNITSAGFALHDYTVASDSGDVPVMIMLTGCGDSETDNIDAFTRSQMWDVPDRDKLLEDCKYQVVATDLLAGGLDGTRRAELEVRFAEALVELYPTCKAVLFMNSGKLLYADKIRFCELPREDRFVFYAVNQRFFKVSGSDEMIVDSLGMSTLGLRDLQYRFKSLDPNHIVHHGYNVLLYICQNGDVFKDGDTVDGIDKNGDMCEDIQWKCTFGQALIQPRRNVMEIEVNS